MPYHAIFHSYGSKYLLGSSSSTATVSKIYQAVGTYLTLELHFATWERFRLSGCDAELKRFRHGVRIQSRSAETKPWAWQPSRRVWIHSSIGWTNRFSTMFKGTFVSGIYIYTHTLYTYIYIHVHIVYIIYILNTYSISKMLWVVSNLFQPHRRKKLVIWQPFGVHPLWLGWFTIRLRVFHLGMSTRRAPILVGILPEPNQAVHVRGCRWQEMRMLRNNEQEQYPTILWLVKKSKKTLVVFPNLGESFVWLDGFINNYGVVTA